MRIVTFCAHQPYLYLFAGMEGVQFDLIQLNEHRRFLQNWSEQVRPLPEGWELIDMARARERAEAGDYDLCMAHNINDYIDFLPFNLPLILVVHTSLTGRLKEEKSDIDSAVYKAYVHQLITKSAGEVVFTTALKRRDWGLEGEVIFPFVNVADYSGFTGEQASILRVANQLVERGDILMYDFHKFLTRKLPCTVVGHNPSLPDAHVAESWEELKGFYRGHRVYLHTAEPNLEDGFNLAMLEAMSTGMPVISTAHPTSPVIDSYNGFISDDLGELRARLELMLNEPELAQILGANARETVKRKFPISRFHEAWRQAFERAKKKAEGKPSQDVSG